MNSKTKSLILIAALLAILLIEPLHQNIVMAQQSVNGTQDNTFGVWMFSAGTTVPAGAPTDDIIDRAVFYNLLDYIGDAAAEVYEFGYGPSQPTPGEEDKTLAEVVQGLSEIDDFGYLANDDDDRANFDTGSDGYFLGGFDPNDPYVIVQDGTTATGVLGPSGATSAQKAEEAINGYEIFIFEDAELSGMIVNLSNSLGLSITFSITDLQVNPPTQYGADDTLVAIDLDALPGFDGTFISTIRIEDDSITSPSAYGDTTLEIDAIAIRKSVKKPLLGSIGDTVFLDEDRDGFQDIGENGVSGVTVTLVSIDSTTTNGNGHYLFDNLPNGTYTVRVQVPNGYENTTTTSYLIDLDIGEDYLDADFGIALQTVLLGRISGVKFEDIDEDEFQDVGEPGIEGATIQLESPIDSPIAQTITDQDGYYEFLNLPPGDYIVIQTDLPGYYSTTPNNVDVVLEPGEHEIVNFGDARKARIHGIKFEDVNKDGELDVDEQGIEGATVRLLNSTGQEIATTSTDVNGYYEFINLMPGNYIVIHEDLAGYYNTTPNEVSVTLGPGDEIIVNFGDASEEQGTGDFGTIGYWKHVFYVWKTGKGTFKDYMEALLVDYLERINATSRVFSENYTLTMESAYDLLWSHDSSMRTRALKQCLASWLNWADGATTMTQMVDTNYDGVPDMTFGDAMTIVEDIVRDPNSSWSDLEYAKDICDSINNM
jgi:hypothetical protein